MKRIFVFSDSHGVTADMLRLVREGAPEMVLHLGDYDRDCDELRRAFPGLDIRGVRGNCDYRSAAPELLRFTAEGVRVFACHGHNYRVKSGYQTICYAALEAEADLVLFGHTHRALHEKEGKVEFFNPGSVGRGWPPSYGLLRLGDGPLRAEIITL
jgi:putative phosphoesterase